MSADWPAGYRDVHVSDEGLVHTLYCELHAPRGARLATHAEIERFSVEPNYIRCWTYNGYHRISPTDTPPPRPVPKWVAHVPGEDTDGPWLLAHRFDAKDMVRASYGTFRKGTVLEQVEAPLSEATTANDPENPWGPRKVRGREPDYSHEVIRQGPPWWAKSSTGPYGPLDDDVAKWHKLTHVRDYPNPRDRLETLCGYPVLYWDGIIAEIPPGPECSRCGSVEANIEDWERRTAEETRQRRLEQGR